MNNKIKCLICCHKKTELPPNDEKIFLPIQVGSSISDTNLGIQRDDEINGEKCDNISFKNKSFCELTAIYWAWKNIKKIYPEIQYIGLNHYRRYFYYKNTLIKDVIRFKTDKIKTSKYINIKKLNSFLRLGVCLLPRIKIFPFPLSVQFKENHVSDDYYKLKECIKDIEPEYYTDFVFFMEKNNKFYGYNMFFLPIKVFEDYCSFLFKILLTLEKEINIENYSEQQKRIYGYMAEMLTGVYFYHNRNKLKIKTLPIVTFTDEKKDQKPINVLKENVKNSLAFFIVWGYKNLLHKK